MSCAPSQRGVVLTYVRRAFACSKRWSLRSQALISVSAQLELLSGRTAYAKLAAGLCGSSAFQHPSTEAAYGDQLFQAPNTFQSSSVDWVLFTLVITEQRMG